MTEVETLRHVDGRPQPLWEVRVTDFALLLAVFVNHNLLEVVVVQVWLVSKVLENVFNCNVTVIILVQRQECFSNAFIAIGEFKFQFFFKFVKSGCNHMGLLLLMGIQLVPDVVRISVSLVIFILLNEILVWEEVLLVSIEVYTRWSFIENVLVDKKVFELLPGEVRQLVFDHMTSQKALLWNEPHSREIKSRISVFRTWVHFVELMSQCISNFAVHVCFGNTKLKKIRQESETLTSCKKVD